MMRIDRQLPPPPGYRLYFIDLPLCRLHVLETGHGPLLIMVPATLSELEDWNRWPSSWGSGSA